MFDCLQDAIGVSLGGARHEIRLPRSRYYAVALQEMVRKRAIIAGWQSILDGTLPTRCFVVNI